jgi:hypothetical protein
VRHKDNEKAALAERLIKASGSGAPAAEEEGQTEEEGNGSVDPGDDVRLKGKMARKPPDDDQLAFARRPVADLHRTASVASRGRAHQKVPQYIFQIAKGQNSLLRLAQETDPSTQTSKMGSIPALKEYMENKIAQRKKTPGGRPRRGRF